MDGYKWDDSAVLVKSLTRACRLINDRVTDRFPITWKLLEMILFEVERTFYRAGQYFLGDLYKAVFVLCYYGMMRVGEVTESPHVLKAKDTYVGTNKDKFLAILYTSKIHGLG